MLFSTSYLHAVSVKCFLPCHSEILLELKKCKWYAIGGTHRLEPLLVGKGTWPQKVPTFDRLMNPALRALRDLGASGSVEEINDKVAELEGLPEGILSQPHDPEKSNQSEIAYG